jgi:hypothetical protein
VLCWQACKPTPRSNNNEAQKLAEKISHGLVDFGAYIAQFTMSPSITKVAVSVLVLILGAAETAITCFLELKGESSASSTPSNRREYTNRY